MTIYIKEVIERGPIPRTPGRPGLKIIDGRTYEATADSTEEAFFAAG